MESITTLWLACLVSVLSSSQSDYGEAKFSLRTNASEQVINYTGKENLIFAEHYGSEIWIRMAKSKLQNGDKSPHLDIDLCRFSGSGTYKPIDPAARPCKEEFGWDLWWHGEDSVYVNQATSSPCELLLEVKGDTLTGRFSCSDLIVHKGTSKMDILNGSFTCLIRNK